MAASRVRRDQNVTQLAAPSSPVPEHLLSIQNIGSITINMLTLNFNPPAPTRHSRHHKPSSLRPWTLDFSITLTCLYAHWPHTLPHPHHLTLGPTHFSYDSHSHSCSQRLTLTLTLTLALTLTLTRNLALALILTLILTRTFDRDRIFRLQRRKSRLCKRTGPTQS